MAGGLCVPTVDHMITRIARMSYRRRRAVVVLWIGILVAISGLSTAFGGTFRDVFELPGSESQEAFDLLEEHGVDAYTGESGQVVFTADDVTAPEVRRGMEALFAELDAALEDSEIVSPYDAGAGHQISDDGRIAYGAVNLADRGTDEYEEDAETARSLIDAAAVPGTQIELGGDVFIEEAEFSSEAIGLIAAIVILLIAFGSLLAMGLPLLTALFGIGTGVALVTLVVNFVNMPSFATQTVLMIGIGVGIDYALFIVTRYREELTNGTTPEAAVVRALSTAGRAVLFAGTTVIIAILGLLLIGLDMVRGLAVGISIGVATTMLATLTLLPAVLGFVGRNIDRLGLPHRRRAQAGGDHRSIWFRWSRVIQRRPWPALIIATGVLLLLAAPLFSLRLGFGDTGNQPTDTTTRRAYDLISEGFGPGSNGPLLIAAETPAGASDVAVLEELAAELNRTPGVAFAAPPRANDSASAAFMTVIPTTSPQDEATTDLVHALRDEVIPPVVEGSTAEVKVGGGPSAVVDVAEYMNQRLLWLIAAVLAVSFLVLVVVFRSVVVPVQAIVMNLLSVGAAYGILVAVFQWGWGAGLLGIGRAGPIDAWVPMMLFAIVFGLSMDYEVFLLSRIREHYDRSRDKPLSPTAPSEAGDWRRRHNSIAVANGLASTARVITAAAAIMVCVFGAFVLGDERSLQMFGLGLAAAIAIDATIVRLMIVPSAMEVVGGRNWWLPDWLDRVLPRIDFDRADAPTGDGDRSGAPGEARGAEPVAVESGM
jgi:putative drug exporter of the RND superfamily